MVGDEAFLDLLTLFCRHDLVDLLLDAASREGLFQTIHLLQTGALELVSTRTL